MTRELETGMQALSRYFAGQQFRVPRDPAKLLRLLPSELDEAAARQVCDQYGGCRLYVRKTTRTDAEARNSLIRVRRSHGASISDLAEEFNLSERQVSNILGSIPK